MTHFMAAMRVSFVRRTALLSQHAVVVVEFIRVYDSIRQVDYHVCLARSGPQCERFQLCLYPGEVCVKFDSRTLQGNLVN